MSGKLYIVPTPIGNMEDITLRAIRVLKEVDFILAEDTRNSIHLLKHFSIEKSLRPFHQHNEHKISGAVLEELKSGKNIALVSDAGTPGISDPAFLLVRACIEENVEVETLPGATAFVPALVNSGLPTETFTFVGFLPQKKGRATKINSLSQEQKTMVFYESPFRLLKILNEFLIAFGSQRRASVSRELTKIYEETQRGTLQELITYFETKNIKGEIVIVVEGFSKKENKNGKAQEEE